MTGRKGQGRIAPQKPAPLRAGSGCFPSVGPSLHRLNQGRALGRCLSEETAPGTLPLDLSQGHKTNVLSGTAGMCPEPRGNLPAASLPQWAGQFQGPSSFLLFPYLRLEFPPVTTTLSHIPKWLPHKRTKGYLIWEGNYIPDWYTFMPCIWGGVSELPEFLDQSLNGANGEKPLFIGRTDAEAETPILWPPHVKSWLTGKDPDAGRDWGQEEKGTTEDEMVGWHHRLDGPEFE